MRSEVVEKTEQATEARSVRPARTRPSLHFFLIAAIFAMALVGYVAVIWSGNVRGYTPSKLVAARDLALFVPILAVLLWLTRVQRYRGELILFTAAVFLFAIGQLTQFRLFSDPEYGARGSERAAAREAKAQTIRRLNIETGYDSQKKTFMFGDEAAIPQTPAAVRLPAATDYTLFDILKSVNTYIPLAALLAFALAFKMFQSENALLWLQRHALIISLTTLLPFAIVVLLFSQGGKFLGQTTPWEGVKILFLVGFAGMLTDTYIHLRRTRWGLPPVRYLLPFAVIAVMPVVPFFALSDFGQMLVFLGVYAMLYIVAVRKRSQIAYAMILVAVLFGTFFAASSARTGFGIPGRVYFRFYQWTHTWEPPPLETWWWKKDHEKYLELKNLSPDPANSREARRLNAEAWSDKVLQQSQGIFGVHEGGVIGDGLGLGFPETVPVSDSDFIYAAVSEETGLAGTLAVLVALVAVVFAGTAISLAASDMFSKLLAAGLTAFITLQAVINIGGVLRLLPMTGITLPFVSHGGWSLITSFAMLGILLALSHRTGLSRGQQPNREPR